MNKRLAWIALLSLGISALCLLTVLSLAASWSGDESWAAKFRTCGMPWAKKAGSAAQDAAGRTADLEWRGGDAVKINIPARVYFQPGPKPQASVSGDAELIGHVRLRDGRLDWDSVVNCLSADGLVVRFSGPAVTAWTLNGSGLLDLSDVRQDALRIAMHGSGTVTASGEVQEASLDVAGSGRADLSRLVARQASARIRGSAEADLAPRQDVDVSISGSAVVRLHGEGARIHSKVSGSGQIKQLP